MSGIPVHEPTDSFSTGVSVCEMSGYHGNGDFDLPFVYPTLLQHQAEDIFHINSGRDAMETGVKDGAETMKSSMRFRSNTLITQYTTDTLPISKYITKYMT